ncbi:hypothetical protein EDD36DRAFT_263374 [Exophiala viscosa]|uniref:Transcription factor domain-containing protein n=1 Tax=Exophiala viscosa TaxID=2486360 RepID=A0AAN6DXQ1_9EURO|nr:hypothetical protein EDD36DRAFT_263374 [Exophiala viscosa]
MATGVAEVDSDVRFSGSRQWPGERHPTRWDVHDANESPAITFLDRFRAALLHAEGAGEGAFPDTDSMMNSSEHLETNPARAYTYPVVMLSDIPTVLPEDEIARLHAAYFASFNQIFIDAVDIPGTSSNPLPPYLRIARACLGSISVPATSTSGYAIADGTDQTDLSAGLFVTAARLWTVIIEVDNREARMLEAVIAASLLITYGVLSIDRVHWRITTGILCNVVTMLRRLHLTDGYSPLCASPELPEKDFGIKSSLVSYLLLLDTVHAVHYGLVPHFSRTELFMKMPSSNHQFRTLYNSLTHGYALPQDVRTREDGLLLLTMLLSDIIYAQRCHLSIPGPSTSQVDVNPRSSTDRTPLRNPFAPLSLQSEYSRLSADFLAALSRWEQHFHRYVGSDILALYYFVRLQLICPDIGSLPRLAGYGTVPACSGRQCSSAERPEQIDIPDKAMDLAWLVLDHCDGNSQDLQRRMVVWIPVILFYSALVVWQKLYSQPFTDLKYGSLKVLGMYKDEIAKMPWPCCKAMADTLDRLMKR